LEALQHSKEIHGYNIRSALGFNSFVETSLIYMFTECGCIENACLAFDRIYQGDIATWNAMIAGYDMHGHGDSIALIDKMKEVGFIPNHITFTALLSAYNLYTKHDMLEGEKSILAYMIHITRIETSIFNGL
jgi:hypothetical protein